MGLGQRTLEDLGVTFTETYQNRRVLVTGHTGFKGSWLCEWLLSLGAQVVGLSLPADGTGTLFTDLALGPRLTDLRGDVRDLAAVERVVREWKPDFVFHLAAQPLVRLSYDDPHGTFETNVIGTINLLEALRRLDHPCAAIMVTTDKCYENREWVHSYREVDPLGGHDPYSASKAAAEICVSSYIRSFFQKHPVRVATARAGNVIGGGDWASDRIVPDTIRALMQGSPVRLRNPRSTRPWQHVLEPLSGYLCLAAAIHRAPEAPAAERLALCSAFNFGPTLSSNVPVQRLVEEILQLWPGEWQDASISGNVHEAHRLNLSIDKANHLLGWQPVWTLPETVRHTVQWYHQWNAHGDVSSLTRLQIETYTADARRIAVDWATGASSPHASSSCLTPLQNCDLRFSA